MQKPLNQPNLMPHTFSSIFENINTTERNLFLKQLSKKAAPDARLRLSCILIATDSAMLQNVNVPQIK